MEITSDFILQKLYAVADPKVAEQLQKFFKTGKGQYAEGDVFLGIKVPQIRAIVKINGTLPLQELQILLDSPYHEARFSGWMFLVQDFKKAKTENDRRKIFDFYIVNISKANNWDLVDCSCRDVVGAYLLDKPDRSILYHLAESENLWEQRMAIIATWTFIKHKDYADTLALSVKLMQHPHDLMHKAIGWMLREVGKKDRDTLTRFLEEYCKIIPRTTLRYAIEHYLPEERIQWLARD